MDTVLLEFETRYDPKTNAAGDGEPRRLKLRVEFPPEETTDRGYPIPISYRVAPEEVRDIEPQLLDWLEMARATV